MASSSSNPHVTLEVGAECPYPYPSHVYTPSFVTVKLSGREKYGIWETQMLCLLKSHGMFGFIDGTHASPQTSSTVTGKEKVGDYHTQWLWTRSDALVKGWILGSLSEQTLMYVVARLREKVHQQSNIASDFSAKDVWDELQAIYAPAAIPQVLVVEENSANQIEEERKAKIPEHLYDCTREGNWYEIDQILSETEVTVIDKITNNGDTALHVAVGVTKEPEFLEKMLGRAPENTSLLDVRNSDGSTLLHVAAIIGNTEAVKILMARNRDLLLAKDNEGHTPLALALSNMHTETSKHLLQHITAIERKTLFSGTSGDELLATVISSKDFDLARHVLHEYETFQSDAVLMALAQNFPSDLKLNVFEKYIGTDIVHDRISALNGDFIEYISDHAPNWVFQVLRIFSVLYCAIYWMMFKPFLLIPQILVSPFIKERDRVYGDAKILLWNVCTMIKARKHPSTYHHYYTNPLLEATRQNAIAVVQLIVLFFPNATLCANEDGHSIIQYAMINRSEKVYNILYLMSEHKNIYRTIKDSYGNNLLHLAARLAPTNKLKLISGAALQIQRELQWFKEVEGFVCPLNIIQKNSYEETPQMVFTREHKELVNEGEKWMKATAESYTITAALIITIVFAAAITVPGGNNQDTGIPIFTNDYAFTIFAISDAISLFIAVTSLLMFLSILTARFAEQDFLFKLPTKLMIGLATLFISTTAMIVAFGATLYLVFGQRNSKILIPIALLTCLPITSFVTLQFPLVIDLISATYGRSIFGTKFPLL